MTEQLSQEELAAQEAEAARLAAEGAAGNEGGESPEEIAAKEEAARLAAEAAASGPPAEDDIPEEKIYSALSKMTGEKVKSKEDLDRVLSINETDYIKVNPNKANLIKMLNESDADPKQILELVELDVDNLTDKKEGIIKNMQVQKGYSREDAELMFEKKYGAAFLSEEDVDYDAKQKRIAELLLEEDFTSAKDGLSKYKLEKLGSMVQMKPTEEQIAAAEKEHEEKWVKPISAIVDSVSKIESSVTFKLPDEQEATESIAFEANNQETKDLIKSIVLEPQTFAANFAKEFGQGKTPEEGFANLSSNIYKLRHFDDLMALAAQAGASKAIAEHLEKVNPGSLKRMTTTTVVPGEGNGKTMEQALVEQMNAKMGLK